MFSKRKHISLDLSRTYCILSFRTLLQYMCICVCVCVIIVFSLSQREDWPMHKLECSPMVVLGENWNPSETVRLTARILAKQVRNWDHVQVCFIFIFLKGQKDE